MWTKIVADAFDKVFPPLRENRLARKRRRRAYGNPRPASYGHRWVKHMQRMERQRQSAVVSSLKRKRAG